MSDLLWTRWHSPDHHMLFFRYIKETIENSITRTTKFSLRLFHTIHGISKQSNLEEFSEGHLIQPTAQSGANFRSSWEYLQGRRLHSIPGQLVPLLDHPYSKNPLLIFLSLCQQLPAQKPAACGQSVRIISPCCQVLWAPCFFSGTLHSFYPTQTQMQSQYLASGRVTPGSWEQAQTCVLPTAQSECQTLEMACNFIPYTAFLLLLLLENTACMLICHQSNVLQKLVEPST